MSDQELAAAVARLREDACTPAKVPEKDHVVLVRTADIRTVLAALEAAQAKEKIAKGFHDIAVRQRDAAWRECERLRAALETAQTDARRYRWLHDNARREGRDGGWTGLYTFPVVHAWDDTPYAAARREGFHHETLDAAIDAAMKSKP